MAITDDQAAEALLRRRQAQTHFVDFCRFIAPDEPPAYHHQVICDALDKVIDGVIRRLMIFMPPGSAKSTYTSVRFPPYYLGRKPKNSIICASYGEGLSTTFGRKVRNIVGEDREYHKLYENTRLAKDAQAKGEWETQDGGAYFASSVGGSITGRRADLGLIDDPVKSREQADSELERERTWQWYRSDFFSRLKPNAAQVIIQTRWHEDDLSGRILPDDWNGESGEFVGFDGQVWTVICMPAQAREGDILGREPGDWLWPDFFTPESWDEIKQVQTAQDTRNWTALYQQVPQPESGDFFRRDWFKRFHLGEEPPVAPYAASDYAVSSGKGDFTEHGIAGFDEKEDLWFLDWWSGQETIDVSIDHQLRLADKWKPYIWAAEVGVIRRAIEPYLKKAKREKRISFRQEWLPHIGDKAANARAFQAAAAEGRVHIPYGEWGDALLNQLVKFIPNTNFKDDKVDVCGLFGRLLDQTYGVYTTKPDPKPVYDGYGFEDEQETGWKTA